MYSRPKLRRNFDIVTLNDFSSIFKSEHNKIKFQGKNVQEFIQKVIPLLDGHNTFNDIIELLQDFKRLDVENCIALLDKNNMIEEGDTQAYYQSNVKNSPQLQLFRELGILPNLALKRIRDVRVAIFGIGGYGAYLASALANEGVVQIKCLDPSIVREEDPYLSTIYQKEDIGKRKEEALKKNLEARFSSLQVQVSNLSKVNQTEIEKWIDDCNIAICCVDKGFSSIFFWLNKATLDLGIPWLSASIEGMEGMIGPMVIPKETACYMCYNMRLLSNESSYSDAMAYQKFLDNNKKDELYRRSNFSINMVMMANLLAMEALKFILQFPSQSVVGNIRLINFATMESTFHNVLRRPDCPHCGLNFKKKDLNRIVRSEKSQIQSPDILMLERSLVSSRVGVIKKVIKIQKDETIPELPYVYASTLSNFNYSNEAKEDLLLCSGKALTIHEAKRGALGESVERYCGSQYDEKDLRFASYKELESVAMNPRELVLYAEEQYASKKISCARFSEDAVLGWTDGISLLSLERCFVPAIGVYLQYVPRSFDEFIILPTSNGLAAGASFKQAALAALLEVVERDAFLITWLCKLSMPLVDLETIHTKEITDLIRMYERLGIKIFVNSLLLDTAIPTFMATGCNITNRGPAAVVGLSAHPNSEYGILKAIMEIGQVYPHIKNAMKQSDYDTRLNEMMTFENVKTLFDHELLYTSEAMLYAFDFLLKNEQYVSVRDLPTFCGSTNDQLNYCLENLKKTGVDVVCVDVSTTDISSLGLTVNKIIIPGFQPMHFGYYETRLGGHRLFDIPLNLGFLDHKLALSDLNRIPHPLG
jgi:ribosomal protein S12 methylthiotransferase accessory factor